jgi:hypothetical protein
LGAFASFAIFAVVAILNPQLAACGWQLAAVIGEAGTGHYCRLPAAY